jgi:hypothetical protein
MAEFRDGVTGELRHVLTTEAPTCSFVCRQILTISIALQQVTFIYDRARISFGIDPTSARQHSGTLLQRVACHSLSASSRRCSGCARGCARVMVHLASMAPSSSIRHTEVFPVPSLRRRHSSTFRIPQLRQGMALRLGSIPLPWQRRSSHRIANAIATFLLDSVSSCRLPLANELLILC